MREQQEGDVGEGGEPTGAAAIAAMAMCDGLREGLVDWNRGDSLMTADAGKVMSAEMAREQIE